MKRTAEPAGPTRGTQQRWSVLLVACVASAPTVAFDWGLAAHAGYARTDNVSQAPQGESADILTTDISAALEHNSRTLLLDAEAHYQYRYFLDDAYDAEAQPQVRGELEWVPVPERFRINVRDVYGQLALNPAEGLLPSQYENANVLTVTPAVLLPLTVDSRVQLTGEYRNATFEESSIDSQRRLVELRVAHDLTGLVTLFGGAATSRTEQDRENSTTSFDVDSAFVGVDAVGRRSALTLDVGLDSLQGENGDKFDGARYDLMYERTIRRGTRLFISGSREIADAADVFSLAQMSDAALSGIQDVQLTSQPLVRQAYMLGLSQTGHRLSLALTAGYRKEQFDLVPQESEPSPGLDRNIRELQVDSQYVFSPAISMSLRAEALRERFVSGDRSDDLMSTLTWMQRLSPRMSFEARVQHIDRSNSPRDFHELRFFLLLRYAVRELPAGPVSAFDRAFERRIQRVRERADEHIDTSGAVPSPAEMTDGER